MPKGSPAFIINYDHGKLSHVRAISIRNPFRMCARRQIGDVEQNDDRQTFLSARSLSAVLRSFAPQVASYFLICHLHTFTASSNAEWMRRAQLSEVHTLAKELARKLR